MSVFEVFGLFYKTSEDLLNFFHDSRGQYGVLFEPDEFSKEILYPGL